MVRIVEKIWKTFRNLDKLRIKLNSLEREEQKILDCLDKANNVKDEIECLLVEKRKKIKKLKEKIAPY